MFSERFLISDKSSWFWWDSWANLPSRIIYLTYLSKIPPWMHLHWRLGIYHWWKGTAQSRADSRMHAWMLRQYICTLPYHDFKRSLLAGQRWKIIMTHISYKLKVPLCVLWNTQPRRMVSTSFTKWQYLFTPEHHCVGSSWILIF